LASGTKVDLSWNSVTGATGYIVYRSLDNSSFAPLSYVSGATSYADTSCSLNTTYYYYAVATASSSSSLPSNHVSETTSLAPPTNLTAVPNNQNVLLTWTAPPDATSYKIYRSTSSGVETLYATSASSSYTDTAVTSGTTYYYEVTAVYSARESDKSNEAFATLLAAPMLSATTYSSSEIDLSWTSVSGATIYTVYKSLDGSSFTIADVVAGTTYYDTGLSANTTYYYYVTASDTNSFSAQSNHVSQTTLALPVSVAVTKKAYHASTYTREWPLDVNDPHWARDDALIYDASTFVPDYLDGYALIDMGVSGILSTQVLVSFWGDSPGGDDLYGSSLYGSDDGVNWSSVDWYNAYDWDPNSIYFPVAINPSTYRYYELVFSNDIQDHRAVEIRQFNIVCASDSLPPAPTNLTATALGQQVSLTWTASSGAMYYNVYRSPYTDFGSYYLTANRVTGTSYTDSVPADGTAYNYEVTAVNSAGESEPSNPVYVTPCLAPWLAAKTVSSSEIDLSWSNVSSTNYGYNYAIYRSTNGWLFSCIYTDSSLSHADTGLSANTTYYYYVVAITTAYNSIPNYSYSFPSNTVSQTTNPSDPGVNGAHAYHANGNYVSPLAASDASWVEDNALLSGTSSFSVTATGGAALVDLGSSGYSATQAQVEAGADGLADGSYCLYGSDDGATWSSISIPSGWSIGTYAASISQTYRYYQFVLIDILGISDISLPQCNIVHGAAVVPSAPTALTVTSSSLKNTLTWSASSGANSYNIYRGSSSGGESSTPLATGVTSTTFTDSNASIGTTSYYEVTAVNSAGASADSNEAYATALDTPVLQRQYYLGEAAFPPEIGATETTLYWGEIAGATGYMLYRSSDKNLFLPVASIEQNNWEYTDTGLTPGTTYDYYLVAIAPNSTSGTSNDLSITTLPTTPTNLTATAVSQAISLTWTASVGAVSYNIYRGTSSGGEAGVPIATGVTSTNYLDSTVMNGTTYYYRVTAVDSGGETDMSNEAHAVFALSVPTKLSATAGNNQVALTWTGISGATSYNIYRGTSLGGEGSTPFATGITSANYTDSAVTSGTTYYYEVTAITSSGESLPSNEAYATPLAPLMLTAAAVSSFEIDLSWTSVEGATGYMVYISADGSTFSYVTTVAQTCYASGVYTAITPYGYYGKLLANT
ncbi:MAG: hypothetical protein P4L81_02030, partial [Candidatus Pacebacteria bacterium]|nr:hypothetical protein [Candidatus Paceibacterota bacterium]